ncbi:MAG: VCBS repeat-containing protein [Planctomycetes bacterium]|nr:VCBS repeat-containing protein [Planctomycetota bacterium]
MTPAPHATSVANAAPITLTLNAPVLASSVTPAVARVAGRWSGSVPGTWSLDPTGTVLRFDPARPYFAGEYVQVMLARDLRSTSGTALAGGFAAGFFAGALPSSSGSFALGSTVSYRRAGEGLVRTYGFFAGDIDRDGAPDMSATNEVSFDVRLLKNDGCGNFGAIAVTALPSGEEPSPNEGGDLNGDGWLDLATGNQLGQSMAVFLNSGTGSYLPPVIYPVGGNVHGLALADVEGDGDLDAFVPNQSAVQLLRNAGNGTFGAATAIEAGNGEWSLGTGDANGDGLADLFCGAAFGQTVSVRLGDGNGGFGAAQARSCGGFPWAMALGDIDGDGRLDCLVANNQQNTLGVLRGNGDGTLQPVQLYAVGQRPVSVDLADLDGDGDLDVATANFAGANATVLRNVGGGVFAPWLTLAARTAGSCTVLVDFDRDGDVDITVTDELSDEGFVYWQQGPLVSGVAAPTCAAALRLDERAGRAGYGGRPAHLVDPGTTLFLGLSGAPSSPWLLLAGAAQTPAIPTPFGPLSLATPPPLLVLASGSLDGFGEQRIPVPVPLGLVSGAELAFQGLVLVGVQPQLTNPELARVR